MEPVTIIRNVSYAGTSLTRGWSPVTFLHFSMLCVHRILYFCSTCWQIWQHRTMTYFAIYFSPRKCKHLFLNDKMLIWNKTILLYTYLQVWCHLETTGKSFNNQLTVKTFVPIGDNCWQLWAFFFSSMQTFLGWLHSTPDFASSQWYSSRFNADLGFDTNTNTKYKYKFSSQW